MGKTWARRKTTETELYNGWRLAAASGWRLEAVGGWRLAVGGPKGLSLMRNIKNWQTPVHLG